MNLTEAEWNVMECLWETSHLTGREATELLEERMGWSRSTTLTMLHRLENKGAVESHTEQGLKVFRPLLRREEAVVEETENFLHRVYKGSLSMLVSSFTQKQALSRNEIDELYAILKKAEEANQDDGMDS